MRRRQYVALTGGIGLTALAGCGGSSDDDAPDEQAEAKPADDNDEQEQAEGSTPEDESTPEQEAEAERNAVGYPSDYIEVRDVQYHEPEDEFAGPSIEGVADNVSGEELSYVEVQVHAFNENDEQIGEAMDNTTDLRAEKSWRFECEFFDVDAEEIEYWMGRAEVSNY